LRRRLKIRQLNKNRRRIPLKSSPKRVPTSKKRRKIPWRLHLRKKKKMRNQK
jgi:hypothetical protein